MGHGKPFPSRKINVYAGCPGKEAVKWFSSSSSSRFVNAASSLCCHCVQKRHALRAYAQALQVYKGRGWSLAEVLPSLVLLS